MAELDKSNCAWLARELQPHLARLMQSNTVHLHVLALLTAQTAQRMFSSGEANVSMADLDRRLYGALAECRGLMAGAALQAVSLYVALRVTLKAEVGRSTGGGARGEGGGGRGGRRAGGETGKWLPF